MVEAYRLTESVPEKMRGGWGEARAPNALLDIMMYGVVTSQYTPPTPLSNSRAAADMAGLYNSSIYILQR